MVDITTIVFIPMQRQVLWALSSTLFAVLWSDSAAGGMLVVVAPCHCSEHRILNHHSGCGNHQGVCGLLLVGEEMTCSEISNWDDELSDVWAQEAALATSREECCIHPPAMPVPRRSYFCAICPQPVDPPISGVWGLFYLFFF